MPTQAKAAVLLSEHSGSEQTEHTQAPPRYVTKALRVSGLPRRIFATNGAGPRVVCSEAVCYTLFFLRIVR